MAAVPFIVLIAISTFFLGCSNNGTSSGTGSNLGELKFGVEGGFNFETVDDFGWNDCQLSVELNNNGTKKHKIMSIVKRIGNNPLFQQDMITIVFEFDLNGDIQVNQMVQIENISDPMIGDDLDLDLPYNNDNYDQTGCNLELEKQSTSTGFIKVTKITNDFVYGEFQFSNLRNLGGRDLNLNVCPNYPTQQNYNIINGTFKASKH